MSKPVPALSDIARAFLAIPRPRPAYPDPSDLAGWRAMIDRFDFDSLVQARAKHGDEPVGVERDGRLFLARAQDPFPSFVGRIVLFFHGGGLVFHSGPIIGYLAMIEARRLRLDIAALDFRQPPDHPFPAAMEDALAAYRQLLERYDPAHICFMASSGGANPAVSALYRAREEGLPAPAGLILINPMIDLTESGPSFTENADDSALPGGMWEAGALYAGGRPLDDPYVSPLFGDPTGFPPTVLQTGEYDVMLSNAVRFYEALAARGVPAQLHIRPACPHGGFGGMSPEDDDARRVLKRFFLALWHDGS